MKGGQSYLAHRKRSRAGEAQLGPWSSFIKEKEEATEGV
jgi:hypothetical protein